MPGMQILHRQKIVSPILIVYTRSRTEMMVFTSCIEMNSLISMLLKTTELLPITSAPVRREWTWISWFVCFCQGFHQMQLEIKQITQYLLMDHPIQKCILHVIVREKRTIGTWHSRCCEHCDGGWSSLTHAGVIFKSLWIVIITFSTLLVITVSGYEIDEMNEGNY